MSNVLKSFETDLCLVEVVTGLKTGDEFYDKKPCLIRITTIGKDVVPQINSVMALFEADDLYEAFGKAVQEAARVEESA